MLFSPQILVRNRPQPVASGSSVAIDAVAASSLSATGTSLNSTALTIGSGSNRALIVYLCFIGANGNTSSGIGVTWNGVSMSAIGARVNNTTVGDIYAYGLVSPASGNNTLAVSWTGSNQCIAFMASVTGANQTGGSTTFANFTSATGSSVNPTISVTNGSGQIAVAAYLDAGSNFTTTGAGTTNIGNNNAGSSWTAAANYATTTNPSMSYTNTANTLWCAAGVSIQ